MGLGDVHHKKVYIAEILDELLELLKFEDKRGSGTTSKTQHQRSVSCREKAPQNLGAEREKQPTTAPQHQHPLYVINNITQVS